MKGNGPTLGVVDQGRSKGKGASERRRLGVATGLGSSVWGTGGCGAEDLDYCVVSFGIGLDMLEQPNKYRAPRLTKPMIGHEFGNWNAFPLVQSLIDRFEANTSAVKPYWLYPALAQLKQLNLTAENERWAAASGALFHETAKMDIEALRVTGNISGFDW